jgi:hypothetical protein
MTLGDLGGLVLVLAIVGGTFAWLRQRATGERLSWRPPSLRSGQRLRAYVLGPAIGLAVSTGVFTLGPDDASGVFVGWATLAATLAAGLSMLLTPGRPQPARTAVFSALVTLAAAALAAGVWVALFILGCFVLPDEPCLR